MAIGIARATDWIGRKLLRDGERMYAEPKGDVYDGYHMLTMAIMATFQAHIAYIDWSGLELLPWSHAIFRFLRYGLIVAAVLIWYSTLYAMAAWRAYKRDHPKADGPIFSAGVHAIRRWAVYISAGVLLTEMAVPDAGWQWLHISQAAHMAIRVAIGMALGVLFAEMFRNFNTKRPWSNNKHAAIATACGVLLAIMNS